MNIWKMKGSQKKATICSYIYLSNEKGITDLIYDKLFNYLNSKEFFFLLSNYFLFSVTHFPLVFKVST